MCHIFIYPQEERVKVVDVSVMNKICNGKFYNDNRKLISVSYIQFTTCLQFNNVLFWQLNIQHYDYAIGAFLQSGNHWVLLVSHMNSLSLNVFIFDHYSASMERHLPSPT